MKPFCIGIGDRSPGVRYEAEEKRKDMPPEHIWVYFTPEEVKGLDQELCAMLDRSRGIAATPFTITSGLRTPEQNEQTPNAVYDSAHLSGHAVDLAVEGSTERFQIVKALLAVGFTRIGIYAAHIHCDNSAVLPPNVLWYVGAA